MYKTAIIKCTESNFNGTIVKPEYQFKAADRLSSNFLYKVTLRSLKKCKIYLVDYFDGYRLHVSVHQHL